MHKGRIEAFSDGVLAIILTIMVLELKTPHDTSFESLFKLAPVFLGYALSFIYIGIYWSNHHHLFQAVQHVSGRVLWANLHLLFWLSLIPFVTGWTSEHGFAPVPAAMYGAVLLMSGVAYSILSQVLIADHGRDSRLAHAIGKDVKGKMSVVIYAVAIFVAQWSPMASYAFYLAVALMWLVPDKRIERTLPK